MPQLKPMSHSQSEQAQSEQAAGVPHSGVTPQACLRHDAPEGRRAPTNRATGTPVACAKAKPAEAGAGV
jgi:hypothetical protein